MTETERIKNRTGTDHCRFCDDGAQVLVKLRPATDSIINRKIVKHPPGAEFEEYGPCPWCESGLMLEFGIGKRRNAKGDLEEYRNPNPPWGPLGYWRGRDPIHA